MRSSRRIGLKGFGITAALLTCAIAASVSAQQVFFQEARFGGPGGGNSFEPAISSSQMKRLAQVLQLNETQGTLADEFLRDYQRQFRLGAERVQDEMSEIQDEARATGDFSVMGEEIGPLFQKWGEESEAMEEHLIADLRNLLTEEQNELWPLFERERRRMDMLPNSRLGGEDVDVILLTQEVCAEEGVPAEVAESLEQYALELDAALQARERTIEGLQEEWIEVLGGEREAMQEIWDEATRKREAVRDINERYARSISEMLKVSDATQGEVFWQTWLERAFPMAFEETRGERMADAAADLDGLAEDTLAQVEGVRIDLDLQLAPITHKLIAELVKEEKDLPPFIQNIRVEGGEGGTRGIALTIGGASDGEEPYGGLLKERWEISKAAVDRLETILPPEQWKSIDSQEDASASQGMMLRGLRFNL